MTLILPRAVTKVLPLSAYAQMSGRPWWALRYSDGRVVEEPDVDWLDAPRRGRKALRLYCPNGDSATFEAAGGGPDAGTGRFLQFKSAVVTASGSRGTLAHIAGMVVGTDGRCVAAAWDTREGKLVRFEDNVYDFRYGNVGRLCADHLGLDTK